MNKSIQQHIEAYRALTCHKSKEKYVNDIIKKKLKAFVGIWVHPNWHSTNKSDYLYIEILPDYTTELVCKSKYPQSSHGSTSLNKTTFDTNLIVDFILQGFYQKRYLCYKYTTKQNRAIINHQHDLFIDVEYNLFTKRIALPPTKLFVYGHEKDVLFSDSYYNTYLCITDKLYKPANSIVASAIKNKPMYDRYWACVAKAKKHKQKLTLADNYVLYMATPSDTMWCDWLIPIQRL